jgi:hypothetical protein
LKINDTKVRIYVDINYNKNLMMGLPKNTSVKDQFFKLDERWSKYPVKHIWVTNAPVKVRICSEYSHFNFMI